MNEDFKTARPMMIAIARPYRSGAGDEPTKMAASLKRLEAAAWPVFRRGHVPMIGEWVALPVLEGAGGGTVGDALHDAVLPPAAARLLEHCDAVLRLEGASAAADNDVRLATARGHLVCRSVDESPQSAG
jgi:hypothetical protein